MTQADRTPPERSSRRRARRFGRARALATAATLGAALIGSTLTTSEAEAAVPRVLRPGTHPMQFLFGFGPSWGIGGSGWYYGGPGGYYGPGGWGRYGGALKLTQEFNGHFSGNASGPALGVIMNQEFAGGYFGFNIAPKFTYDIQPKRDLGLYISPSVSLGYHLSNYRYWNNDGYYYRGASYHAANLQFGVALKLMLGDRGMVFMQFPNFDFVIGPGNYYCAPGDPRCGTYFSARLDFVLGGGVAF